MPNINVQLKNAGGDILYPQTDWNLVQNKPSHKTDVTRFATGAIQAQWIKMCRFIVNASNAKYPFSFIVNTPTSRDFITFQWTNTSLENTDISYATYRNLIQGTKRGYVYDRVSNKIYDLYTYVYSYDELTISDLYLPVWRGSISYDWTWEYATPSSPINLTHFLDYKTASEENINAIFTN